jgi:uncharacterized protein YdiU (UPF0061 family)
VFVSYQCHINGLAQSGLIIEKKEPLGSNLRLWKFNNTYAQLPERFFTRNSPVPVAAPRLIHVNQELAQSLGLEPELLMSDAATGWFSGTTLPEGAAPISQAYAGHQFGHFVPRLGDGRAVLLGEHITPEGHRVDVQLKGSGRNPFSRRGDGRAALGPVLREYIIGEALHALGIPTSRTLAMTLTGEIVTRETPLPGAIQTRVAASHIRIGTFEYFSALEDTEAVKILADYTINRHYPECLQAEHPYRDLLIKIIDRQATLISLWMQCGFIHGVMNTDNVALSGESIDFGPCAFMNHFDSGAVFSSIDSYGRYAYGAQPSIIQWNLARFAEAILPILSENGEEAIEFAQTALRSLSERFNQSWRVGMAAKLGITGPDQDDVSLIKQLLEIMQREQLDYTNTLRGLSDQKLPLPLKDWGKQWFDRLSPVRTGRTVEEALSAMKLVNPSVIARNYLVERAIENAVERGDFSTMHSLVNELRQPFREREANDPYSHPPADGDRNYRTFCGT